MNDLDDKPIRRNGVRKERLAILGVVVLLLGAVALPQAFKKKPETPTVKVQSTKTTPAWTFRGMTLQLHSWWEGIPFEKYVREIAGGGANTICLSVAAYQENCASSSLFIEYRKVPSVRRLNKLIKLAHDLDLRVVLMPIILLENPGAGEWRGKIAPAQPDSWWEDYENYVLFYAKIADAAGAEVFMVGSELVSMEDQSLRWRQLIRKVRKVYKGRLIYSANWDHYKDIEWWGDLDLVGMTVYYDLVGDKASTMEVLLDSWKPIRKEILDWQQKKVNGMPILFTEVGWPSQVGCAKEPWNYYGSKTPDPATQAKCFEAFFKTWRNEKSIAGVFIWEWRNHPDQTGGLKDTSYILTGKPAMKVISRHFRWIGAKYDTQPAPTTATAPTATRPTGGK